MPLSAPPLVGAENKDQREEGEMGRLPALRTGSVEFRHPASPKAHPPTMSFYFEGCTLYSGRVRAPVSMGQGHPQSGLVGRSALPPNQWQPPWERKVLKVSWSGAGGGRKRKRGDQAKLAPRRGFLPLPHRPPGKHKQPEALEGCPESCQVPRRGRCRQTPPPG